MRSGDLSINEVQKTCQISDKTAYKWRKAGPGNSSRPPLQPSKSAPTFAEVRVQHEEITAEPTSNLIIFKRAGCEILLPCNYPIDKLAQLIRTLEAGP